MSEGHMLQQSSSGLHLFATVRTYIWPGRRNVRKLGLEVDDDMVPQTALVPTVLATLEALQPALWRKWFLLILFIVGLLLIYCSPFFTLVNLSPSQFPVRLFLVLLKSL